MSFLAALPANIGKLASTLPTFDQAFLIEKGGLYRLLFETATLTERTNTWRQAFDEALTLETLVKFSLSIDSALLWEKEAIKQYITISFPFLAAYPTNLVKLAFPYYPTSEIVSTAEAVSLFRSILDVALLSEAVNTWRGVMEVPLQLVESVIPPITIFRVSDIPLALQELLIGPIVYLFLEDSFSISEVAQYWESCAQPLRLVEDYTYVILPSDHNLPAKYHRAIPRFAESLLSRIINLAPVIPLAYSKYFVEEYRRLVRELYMLSSRLRTVYTEEEAQAKGLPITLSRILTSDINDRVICWQHQVELMSRAYEVLVTACQRVAYYMKQEKGIDWSCPYLDELLSHFHAASMYAAQMQEVKAGDIFTAAIHNVHANAWNELLLSACRVGAVYYSLRDALETLRAYRQWGYDSAKRGRVPFKGPDMPFLYYLLLYTELGYTEFGGCAVSFGGTVYMPLNWWPGLAILGLEYGLSAVVETDYYVFGSPCIFRPPWYRRIVAFGDNSGTVYAIYPYGLIVWQHVVPGFIYPCITCWNEEVLYPGTRAHEVRAINHDGELLWKYEVDGPAWSAIAVHENGNVYALVDTVDKMYSFTKDGMLRWSYSGPSGYAKGVSVDENGVAYAGGYDPYFWAINPDGTLKFRVTLSDSFRGHTCIDTEGNTYVFDWSGMLYKISPEGEVLWSIGPLEYLCAPALTVDEKGDIYFTNAEYRCYIWCVSSTGSVKWQLLTSSDYVFWAYFSGPVAIPYEGMLTAIPSTGYLHVVTSAYESAYDYYGQALADAANTSHVPFYGPSVPTLSLAWTEYIEGGEVIHPFIAVDMNGNLHYIVEIKSRNWAFHYVRSSLGELLYSGYIERAAPEWAGRALALGFYSRVPLGLQPLVYFISVYSRLYLEGYVLGVGLAARAQLHGDYGDMLYATKLLGKATVYAATFISGYGAFIEKFDYTLSPIWICDLRGRLTPPPGVPAVSDNETVYIQGAAGTGVAVSPNGEILWSVELTGGGMAPVMVIDGDSVAFPRDDGRVYILSSTGTVKAVIEDAVCNVYYVATDSGRRLYTVFAPGYGFTTLKCYDNRGEILWSRLLTGNAVYGPTTDGRDYAYLTTGKLVCVSREGELLWEYETYITLTGPPIIGPGFSIYVASRNTVARITQA